MTGPADVGLPEPVPRDGGTPPPAPLSVPQDLRGDHAGFASRFIAFVVDCVLSIAVFELVLAASSFAASVLTGTSIHWNKGDTVGGARLLRLGVRLLRLLLDGGR